ncbi:MAG: autoinducer synthase [Rhodobacteraceae bacterium]|nr:autoinducer synthase [Paracoccaceae bacterium]
MLRYLKAGELGRYPKLADTMFADRASQFHARLGWDVTVSTEGQERDEYDATDPVYVIWEGRDGAHQGSMRFLPTTGPTMLADHFRHLVPGTPIQSPYIWETTRFCLTPGAPSRVSATLMLGGLELGLAHGLSHAVAVFDARMVRIYRQLGWPPAILGTTGTGREAISAGLWAFEPELRPMLARKARLSVELSQFWIDRALGRGAAGQLTG